MGIAAGVQIYGKRKYEGILSYLRVAVIILQKKNPVLGFINHLLYTAKMLSHIPTKIKQLKQTIEYGQYMVHKMEKIIEETNQEFGTSIPGVSLRGSQLNQIR